MEYNEENEDSLNTDEEETSKNDELIEEEETAEELKERLKKAEEIAENQRIRAEKAEKLAKKPKAEKETPKNENYSLADIRALQDVDDEDVAEVTDYAKYKGISIAEAKKSNVIQNLLRERVEERKTASAAHTGGSKRGSSKSSDEQLIRDADNGKLPEKDDEIMRLAEARMAAKKSLSKKA